MHRASAPSLSRRVAWTLEARLTWEGMENDCINVGSITRTAGGGPSSSKRNIYHAKPFDLRQESGQSNKPYFQMIFAKLSNFQYSEILYRHREVNNRCNACDELDGSYHPIKATIIVWYQHGDDGS